MKDLTISPACLGRVSVLLVALFLFAGESLATITVSSTTGVNPSQCDGSIEVTATGTAGPFELYIAGDNGHVGYVAGVNGIYVFDGLCSGNYTIDVLNAFGCSAVLTTYVEECEAITIWHPATQNPSSCTDNDGFIQFLTPPESGVHPHSYLWSNGHDQLSQHGLSAGTYNLTITDAIGCTGVFAYTLTAQGAPEVETGVTPACEGESNGLIVVAIIPQPDKDFEFEWSAGTPSNTGSYHSELENIPAGDYSVTITEVNSGCASFFSFTVPELPDLGELTLDMTATNPTCFNGVTGTVDVSVFGGSPPYLLKADNGTVVYPLWGSTTIGGFSGGPHEVTVTDECGRTVMGTVTVEELPQDPSSYFEIVTTSFSHESMLGAADGEISVSTVPEGNHTYQWSNFSSGSSITGLTSGEYTVSVTGSDGCVRTRTFNVIGCHNWLATPFEIHVRDELIIDGEVEFELLIDPFFDIPDVGLTNQVPPEYSVVWQRGEDPNNPVEILGYGPTLHLEIDHYFRPYVVVSNGCVTKVYNPVAFPCDQENSEGFLAGFFIAEENRPCENFSDGSVVIQIPNPEGMDVSAEFDNVVLSLDTSTDPIIYALGGLTHDVNYNLEIQIGDDCQFDFGFSLGHRGTDLEFVELNSDDICVYDESCNGIPLGQSFSQPYIDYDHATSWPCRAPLYCGNTKVGHTDKEKKKKVRGYEFYLILLGLLNSNSSSFPSEFVQQRINSYFTSGNVDYCDRIKYCPYTLNITFNGHNPLGGSFNHFSFPDGPNGCVKVHCGYIGGYKICDFSLSGLGFPTDVFPDITIPYDDCIPVSLRLYDLILAYESGLLDDNTSFQNSPTLYNLVASNINEPAAKCASVIICCGGGNEYEVMYDDLDFYIGKCGQTVHPNFEGYTPPEEYEYCYNEVCPDQTCERVLCGYDEVPSMTFQEQYNLTRQYRYFNLEPSEIEIQLCDDNFNGGDNNKLIIINDFNSQEEMTGFGFIKNEGFTVPKGLLKAGYDGSFFYDFGPSKSRQFKTQSPDIKYYYDDWDTEQLVYVESLDDGANGYLLHYQDETSEWTIPIYADGFIEVSHVSLADGGVTVGGTYEGSLILDAGDIGSSDVHTAFLAELSLSGGVIGVQEIGYLDPAYPISFTEGANGGVSVIGKPAWDWVSVNGNTHMMESANSLFVSGTGADGQFQLSGTINGGSPMRLVATAAPKDGGRTTMAFVTDGALFMDGSQILPQPGGNSLVVATLGQNGVLQWSTSFDCGKIDCDNFGLAYGDNNELFVGLTYNSDMTVGNSQLVNAGGNDIAIVKYGPQGVVEWAKPYGSDKGETISEVFFDNGMVYFGGETSGLDGPKTLGELEVFNFTGFEDRVYISYTVDGPEDGQLVIGGGGQGQMAAVDKPPLETAFDVVEVYPNPFTNELHIEVLSGQSTDVKLELLSPLGQVLHESRHWALEGQNKFSINMDAYIPLGVYQLSVKDGHGSGSVHKVVKSKQ